MQRVIRIDQSTTSLRYINENISAFRKKLFSENGHDHEETIWDAESQWIINFYIEDQPISLKNRESVFLAHCKTPFFAVFARTAPPIVKIHNDLNCGELNLPSIMRVLNFEWINGSRYNRDSHIFTLLRIL